jgi:hypothetical protein
MTEEKISEILSRVAKLQDQLTALSTKADVLNGKVDSLNALIQGVKTQQAQAPTLQPAPEPKPVKVPRDYKLIKSRFPGRCRVCGLGFEKGDTIAYGKGPPAFTAHRDCAEV